MKKYPLVLSAILIVVLFTSCQQPTNTTTTPEVLPLVPQFGFTSGTSRVLSSSDVSIAEQVITMYTPMLLGFTSNDSGITGDSVLEYMVMGSKLTVTTDYNVASNLITMDGKFEDGSGFVKLTMDMNQNVYNYEQMMVIKNTDDPAKAPTLPVDHGQAAIYFKLSDIPLDKSGAYHKYIEGYFFQQDSVALMKLDYFGGIDNNGDKVGGVYIHGFTGPATQPDLSVFPDFYNLKVPDIASFYSDTSSWGPAGYNTLFFYYIT